VISVGVHQQHVPATLDAAQKIAEAVNSGIELVVSLSTAAQHRRNINKVFLLLFVHNKKILFPFCLFRENPGRAKVSTPYSDLIPRLRSLPPH